jgi:hypothetical protein
MVKPNNQKELNACPSLGMAAAIFICGAPLSAMVGAMLATTMLGAMELITWPMLLILLTIIAAAGLGAAAGATAETPPIVEPTVIVILVGYAVTNS